MDCLQARILMLFARRHRSELQSDERHDLDSHLEHCGDCRAQARKETAADAALARGMKQVAVPPQLETRILEQLAWQSRPGPWTWLSLAASVLLVVGLGSAYLLRPLPQLTSEMLAVGPGSSAEEVVAWFHEQGIDIKAPDDFNFAHLESCEVALLQGRKVAKLLFVHRGEGEHRGAVAHVYVVSHKDFQIDKDAIQSRSVSSHVVLEPDPNFEFLIIHSGGSLEPFRRGRV